MDKYYRIIFFSAYDVNYDTEMSIIKGTSMTNLDNSRKCSKYSFWNSGKYVGISSIKTLWFLRNMIDSEITNSDL